MDIFDAAENYRSGDPEALIILAGKDYGSGSSRDWAAKGPYLLGVRAVIAESFERIHRSNLVQYSSQCSFFQFTQPFVIKVNRCYINFN